MDKVVNRKSVLKSYISGAQEKKPKKKEKCAYSPITKKGKNLKKSVAKVKKVVRNANLLNEWAENESSKPEIYEAPKIFKNVHSVPSNDSVIYVGKYRETQHLSASVIDLTQSPANSLHEKINLVHSKTLKTIYFPNRNFDRSIKLKKSTATTSLISLPIIEKQKLPRKLNSTTNLSCTDKDKLKVLDIPPEYLNSPGVSTDYNSFFEKSKLTQTDYKMIDWILDIERDIDISPPLSTSGYNSSLDTDTSAEKISSSYSSDSQECVSQDM